MDEKKPLGRPPLVPGDTPARLHITVPSRDYDKADAIAKRYGISIAEVLRRGLTRTIREHE